MARRLVCTSYHPSLTSYDVSCLLIFLYGLLPLWGWALFDCGFFFLQPTILLISAILHFLLHYSTIHAVMLFDPSLLGLFGSVAYSSLDNSIWSLVFLLHGLQAPASHLFPPGRPWPIYFFWASLVLFLTLCSYGFLLTPLGFLSPITLSFILGAYGLAINPLLSLLALLRACCGPFSLFYITFCPWLCHFSLSGLL